MILSCQIYKWDLTPYPNEYFCSKFDFGIDEIDSSVTSEFEINEETTIKKGDWLKAKMLPSGRSLYFGIVDSVDEKTIRCRGLLGLADSTIVTNRISGDSFETHAKKLIELYLTSDVTKQLTALKVAVESKTKHLYQATEVGTRKLNSYLINAFKKYNVKWYIKDVTKDTIYTALKTNNKVLKFSDSLSEIYGWDLYFKKPNSGTENKLLIVNKALENMESPTVLATYYLSEDGVTTNSANHTITRPTVTKTYLYDTTEEKPPTYLEVATSELTGNAYTHEISFKLLLDSKNIDLSDIETGVYAEIWFKRRQYKSVITAIRYVSDENAITITCGNIRSRNMDNFDN